MQAICICRCVQAPSKAKVMASAKQGSDFDVNPAAEDPAFDRASHVGCGTLSRIPRLSRTISAGCLCSDLVRLVRTFFQPVRCDWGTSVCPVNFGAHPDPARLTIPSTDD
jgi:hypothetical protein